jgi:sugar lactone lactonase YvrE
MTALTRIGQQTDILGECPLWDEAAQALWWIDIRRPALRRLEYASGRIDTWSMPDLVGSIALCDDGRLLVALPERIATFDPRTGVLGATVAMPDALPDTFSDGRCDRQGRWWVGTMHNVTRAPEGVLYRLDADGRLSAQHSGICIPNSLAWSPDGRTMYFADSLRYTIFAYDYDAVTGEMSGERVFATSTSPAFADGSTVDAEGFLERRVQRLSRRSLRSRWPRGSSHRRPDPPPDLLRLRRSELRSSLHYDDEPENDRRRARARTDGRQPARHGRRRARPARAAFPPLPSFDEGMTCSRSSPFP